MSLSPTMRARIRREFFPEHYQQALAELERLQEEFSWTVAAILTYARGDIIILPHLVDNTNEDFRDVLGWANDEENERRRKARRAGPLADEEAKLLASIRSKPSQHARRDAYADWLEARGDPRAAYVRVLSEWCRYGDTTRAEDIMARERRLRKGLNRKWLAHVRGIEPPRKVKRKPPTE
jgi:uncharacterized protein (TIGR02996 family)